MLTGTCGRGVDPTMSPEAARGALVLLFVPVPWGKAEGRSLPGTLLCLHQPSVAFSSSAAQSPGNRAMVGHGLCRWHQGVPRGGMGGGDFPLWSH